MAKRTITASLCIAMLAFLIACNQAPPEVQAQDNPTPPIVDVTFGSCDYGPVTENGGGCFKMQNENDCDLQWGTVVSYCPGEQPPPPPPPTTPSSSSVAPPNPGGVHCYFESALQCQKYLNPNYDENYCVAGGGKGVGVCPSECTLYGSNAVVELYDCKSNSSSSSSAPYGTECNGYCKWDTGCVRIATDPDGKYGSAIATCDAAITNCTKNSPPKQTFAYGACPDGGTFTDARDGKTYRWVKIGTQTWMAENLNYNPGSDTHCNDCSKYGVMYTWTTAQTVCPAGWHLPSEREWLVLGNYAAGTDEASCENTLYGTIDICYKNKLKATSGWNNEDTYLSGSGNGTDYYGFTALPGGFYRNDNYGESDNGKTGDNAQWWSTSTLGNCFGAPLLAVTSGSIQAVSYAVGMRDAGSASANCTATNATTMKTKYYANVRCLKD